MKRIIGLVLALLFITSTCFAAGSVTQQSVKVGPGVLHVILTCTGDAANGSIPATDLKAEYIKVLKDGNYALTDVRAFPTPGGTAPDAADVTVKQKNYKTYSSTVAPAVARDILGGAGTNLIHATNAQSIGAGMASYETVTGDLTVGVANQSTNSANYTLILVFEM